MNKDNLLIAGSDNGQLIFWDLRKPESILNAFYRTQTDPICCLALLNENFLFSACEDQSIVIYNLESQSEEEAIELILNPDNDCRRLFPINESRLAYEGSDNSAGFYDLTSGTKIGEFKYDVSVKLEVF